MIAEARFWSHVRKTDYCWFWEGNLHDWGYGRVKVRGRLRPAHRLAYEIAFGPIPANRLVRHLCSEPSCVRPDHLDLVAAPNRIPPSAIEAIRGSKLSLRRLGSLYGVTHARIAQIRRVAGAVR